MRSRGPSGMTLMELLVSLSVSSLLIGAIVGVYYFAVTQWDQGAADSDAYISVSQGAERMCQEIEQARSASVSTLSGGRVRLDIKAMPSAIASIPVDYFPDPTDAGYTPGTTDDICFYLSDTSGNTGTAGNILWRGKTPAGGSFAKDSTWSMYYSSGKGRVTGVSYLSFTVYPSSNTVYVEMTVTGTSGRRTQDRHIIKWVYMRSHD